MVRGGGTVAAALLMGSAALLQQPAAAQRPEANCTFTAPSGDFYDISPLVVRGGDHRIEPNDPPGEREYVYHWNSCGGLSADILPSNPDADCSPGSNGTPRCGCRAGIDAGCQAYQEVPSEYGPYSLGTLASAEYRETFAADGSTQLSALYRDGE